MPTAEHQETAQAVQNGKLYHILLIKTYISYLEKYYPEIDVDEIISYAGISRYELNDMGFWFTQDQADRFYDIVKKRTGNPNIAREAGRMEALSKSYDALRLYVYGFMTPSIAYGLIEKIGNKITRGGTFKTKKLGENSYEIIATPAEGVNEKPYQCENRMGLFEAMAQPFTGEFAFIDHPECIHKGDAHCRYFITWEQPLWLRWKRIRNIVFFVMALLLACLAFFIPVSSLMPSTLGCLLFVFGISLYSWSMEKKGLAEKVVEQSKNAEMLLQETSKRFNDAKLIQEIGQVISKIFDIDKLLLSVMSTLEKHLEYERGMILLSNDNETRLLFKTSFGYTAEEIAFFKGNELHLDNPLSRGPFVLAYKNQMPYLVNDVNDITSDLSDRTRSIVKTVGTHSFVCVPIIYENKSLGILSVENKITQPPPKQSDLNLLMGIAPQIAISIMNARSFERLQASEEKYRDLVESANSIIMRLDTRGRITFVNTFAKEFYGYQGQEMLGKEVLGFLLPHIDPMGNDFSIVFSDFLKNPEDYSHFENVNILKNGGIVWVSWSNKAIFDKDGNLSEILCVGNDITERKKSEEEKRKLEMQLQRSQKMEAIGMLAGGVAHDLNNILSGVVSYPEILLMELPEDSPMRKSLEVIKRSGEKAAAIVLDLLTLARRGVNVSNVVNLNTIVREFIRSPECNRILQYHDNVRCELSLDPELMNILGSEVHLSKTLMNLISNAAEAMEGGGTLTISTENRYVDSLIQGYDLIEEGEYAVLSVSDTGIGISPDDLKRIFEPFYSKKVMGRSGTGLGMAVIWSTLKDHQGYIDVKSTVGQGTRFELYFPITRRELEDQNIHYSLDALKGMEKILVVDDVEDQREIAGKLLDKLGYTVTMAAGGKDAVECVRHGEYDLIILDMIMDPGIDGLETYREVLKIRPKQKAIIVSGFSESDRVRKALDLGAGAYVKKPYRLHEIARAVRAELDRKE